MDQFDRGMREHVRDDMIRRGTYYRLRGYGASGAIGLALAILLLVVMGDCADERAAVDDASPSVDVAITTERPSAS